uniref:Uncharacterized protein n=1 Tax=Arundo donax TaxID=35708 RepID=A0A0A9F1H9_ARUDO
MKASTRKSEIVLFFPSIYPFFLLMMLSTNISTEQKLQIMAARFIAASY